MDLHNICSSQFSFLIIIMSVIALSILFHKFPNKHRTLMMVTVLVWFFFLAIRNKSLMAWLHPLRLNFKNRKKSLDLHRQTCGQSAPERVQPKEDAWNHLTAER